MMYAFGQRPEAHVWSGPITSAYGDHFIRISENTPGFLPALEGINSINLG